MHKNNKSMRQVNTNHMSSSLSSCIIVSSGEAGRRRASAYYTGCSKKCKYRSFGRLRLDNVLRYNF